MIKYVILIKIKADAPNGKLEEVLKELKDLGNIIPEVKNGSVGKISSSIDFVSGSNFSSSDWDIAVVWEFDNQEAIDRYIRHPFHGPMDARIRPYFEKSITSRYEFEPGVI